MATKHYFLRQVLGKTERSEENTSQFVIPVLGIGAGRRCPLVANFEAGPWQNRYRAVKSHGEMNWFCSQSLAKQTKSYPEHSFLNSVLSKTAYCIKDIKGVV